MLFALLPTDAPAGFRPVSMRELNRLQLPERTWQITLRGEKVRIETRVEYVKRMRTEAAKSSWKPVARWKENRQLNLSWAPGTDVRVEDGWLKAYNAGEWGGALYWLSPKGDRRVRISEFNTSIVVKTSRGIFAVEALAHLGFSYSRLVEVQRKGSGWSTRLVTDLHEAPREIVQDGEQLVYITRVRLGAPDRWSAT